MFPQQRTYRRGVRQALGSLVCPGRRCLSRIIWTNGGQLRSWSAEYFLHSRCQWEPSAVADPPGSNAPARRPAQSNRSNIRQRSSRRTSRAILSKWACNCERTWTRPGGSPVFAGKLTQQHLLDAAGLAQFEKIRLAAVLQLDDKWLLAKAAVTTHRCKQLLLAQTPERNA